MLSSYRASAFVLPHLSAAEVAEAKGPSVTLASFDRFLLTGVGARPLDELISTHTSVYIC